MEEEKDKNMENLNKRYMLFLFGDFSLNENFVNEIPNQLVSIVNSKFIKFNYGEFGMACHFRSKETFFDLKEYIDMVINDAADQYFLVEVGENFDIKMDRKFKKDFINIDGEKPENKSGSIEVNDVILPKFNKKEIDNVFHMMFPIMDPNFFKNNEEIKEPTVDEILDKITEKGIESLTEKEKKILENYGKK